MNWFINIILCQLLLSQVSSDWPCLKTEQCTCNKNTDTEEKEIICNSLTVKAHSRESSIHIDCQSEETLWEKIFDQINVETLSYSSCFLPDTGIKQTISTLGIIDIQNKLTLSYMMLNGSLEGYYLSDLEHVKVLKITSVQRLVLTNGSFQGTPKLTQLFLRENNIEEIPSDVFKHLTQLSFLDLGENKISRIDNNLFNGISLKSLLLDSNNLKTLSLNVHSLENLDLSNNRLTSTVMDLKNLIQLSLNKNFNLTTLPDQPFQNTSLHMFKFNYGYFIVPSKFLSSLNQLQSVELVDLNLDKVPEDMIWNSPNITKLSLASNHLIELPETFFKDSSKMKVLDLSKNRIKGINSELLKPLKHLEKLDLSNNLILQINNYGFRDLINLVELNLNKNNLIFIERETLYIPSLKSLSISHNNISSLYSANNFFSLENLFSIEYIDLSYNNISKIGDGWLSLLKLTYVNLSKNSFNVLTIYDIQFLRSQTKVDLTSNPITIIDLSNLEIFARGQPTLDNPRQITVSSDKFICDGRNYQFGRFIHKKMPKLVENYLNIEQDMICDDGSGQKFANKDIDKFLIDWDMFYDSNKSNCTECVCAYRPYDNSAIMNCSNRNLTLAPEKIITSKNINYTEVNLSYNSITELPNYENLKIGKLDVSHNNLSRINMTQLPINLTVLNVEHNKLSVIAEANDNTLSKLENIRMSDNQWLCGCAGIIAIGFVNKYSKKIQDSVNVTCSSDPSKKLESLSADDLCQINYSQCIIIVLAVLAIGTIIVLVYKTEIAIQLHHYLPTMFSNNHGYTKKYSAFVSYAHEDQNFVQNDLIPMLETDTESIKLCVHYRDWEVGQWIPDQIVRSVHESHRTIILVTSNFLKSFWCHKEFKIVFQNALTERKKHIIIFFEGLTVKDLEPQFQGYVSWYTYIEWEDPNFWKRLKYALRNDKIN